MSANPLPGVANVRLKTLISDVRDLFNAKGISTAILVGEEHIAQEGNGNRAVFVPRPRVGEIRSAPIRLSQTGSGRLKFGCTVYIWGVSGEDPETRYDQAEQILFNLMVALSDASGDRVEFEGLDREESPRDVRYGEDYYFSFVYFYEVRRSTDLQPIPQGTSIAVDPTVGPKEPS